MMSIAFTRTAASALALAAVAGFATSAGGTPALGSPQSARAAAKAAKALGKHDPDRAVEQAERAVGLAPRDARNRALLGRAYLAAGRFASAAASFRDSLALHPGEPGAGMSLALCQIALGDWDAAHATLEGLRGRVSETDRGLGLALAGDREGAIDALEAAARAPGADAKARQNLALAYALDGRWSQARSTAAQDLAGAQLDQRMREWAVFSQPRSAWDQVAMLLNVTPVRDPGQPTALALSAPAAAPAAAAAVAPVTPEPAVTAAADPVTPPYAAPEAAKSASADPVIEAVPAAMAVPGTLHAATAAKVFAAPRAKPAPAAAVAPVAFAPAADAVVADPETATVVATTIPERQPTRLIATPVKPAKVALLRDRAPEPWFKPAANGRFVVQLGAFAKSANMETAWGRASGRLARLAAFTPSGASFALRGVALHRLVLSGFETRASATKVCIAIKAKGGDCFVRAGAGEQPLEWARKTVKEPTRLASR